jgi:hypothetical protein
MSSPIRRPVLSRVKAERRAPRLSRTPPVVRVACPAVVRPSRQGAVAAPSSAPINFLPDPYPHYARFLTPQGGIAITYKDLDERFRHRLVRGLLWSGVTLVEAWILFGHASSRNILVNIALLIIAAIVNWQIVKKPVETYRTIEIRPDCMILEESDVFWLRNMENGWPAFQGQTLCGFYGTRYVEYLTVRRFDPLDRMPEVIAAHLQDAMRQLWSWTQ